MGVDFTQTKEKDEKDKKNLNIKWESHCFHWGNQYHWEAECPNPEEENNQQLHTNVGTVK